MKPLELLLFAIDSKPVPLRLLLDRSVIDVHEKTLGKFIQKENLDEVAANRTRIGSMSPMRCPE